MIVIFKIFLKYMGEFDKNLLFFKLLLYITNMRVCNYGTDARINPKRS